MILFIIGFIVLVVGMRLMAYGKHNHSGYEEIGILLTVVAIISLFIMLCVSEFKNVFHDRDLAMLESRRDAIVYQMEHELYLGDTLGDFNADIIYHQSLHESPWTNAFIGDYWMEIEPIEVKGESNGT